MKITKITKLIAFSILACLCSLPSIAQKKTGVTEAAYRRSSLHTILLESGDFLNKDLVTKSYNLAPFPAKYNDHRLTETTIDSKLYPIQKTEQKDKKQEEKGKEKVSKSEKENSLIIKKYFNEKKIANQIVAKWFGRKEDGSFNMTMIHERGSYDATEMETQIAKGSIRGMASIKDAGEELIKNTFIVVNTMNFVENEPIALAVKITATEVARQMPNAMLRDAAIATAEATYIATKDGYSVWAISYLYQLEWNDDIANTFYMEMWMDSTSATAEKKILFDNSNIFKLNYIGFEKAKSLVLVGIGKSKEDIIQQATIRNIDKVYTKLQKEYDVFKTKTPIYSVDPILAKIGLKEGVTDKDKFDVLEQVIDKKTGLTVYAKVATVKVDSKNIWDNRYNMGIDDEKPENADLKGTHFKGGGKIQPGMLLRLVK